MDRKLSLAQLTDQPVDSIEINGRLYGLGEIPFEGLGRLQAWIEKRYPHPIQQLKGQLEGMAPEDRAELLRQAREEGRNWPVQVGTAAGAALLLSTEDGQVRALWEALRVHQPDVSEPEARSAYKWLGKDAARAAKVKKLAPGSAAAEAKVSRIFAVAFGQDLDLDDVDDGDGADALPKA